MAGLHAAGKSGKIACDSVFGPDATTLSIKVDSVIVPRDLTHVIFSDPEWPGTLRTLCVRTLNVVYYVSSGADILGRLHNEGSDVII